MSEKKSNQLPSQVPVDITNTSPVISDDGNQVFQEGVILRKVSKFVTGAEEDGVIPIPIFYDVQTGKILLETIPKDIRSDYEETITV